MSIDDQKLMAKLDEWQKLKGQLQELTQMERSIRMGIINHFKLEGRKYLPDGRRIDVERRYKKYRLRQDADIPSIPKYLADKLLTTDIKLNQREFNQLTEAEQEDMREYIEEVLSEYGSLKVDTVKKPQLPDPETLSYEVPV